MKTASVGGGEIAREMEAGGDVGECEIPKPTASFGGGEIEREMEAGGGAGEWEIAKPTTSVAGGEITTKMDAGGGVGTIFLQKLNDYLTDESRTYYNYLQSRLRKDLEALRSCTEEVVEIFKDEERWSRLTEARKVIYGVEDEVDKIMVNTRTTKWMPHIILSNGIFKQQLKQLEVLKNPNLLPRVDKIQQTAENEELFKAGHMPRQEDNEDGLVPNKIQEELRRLLLGFDEDDNDHRQLSAVFVTGMEGIGKTFLVRKVWDAKEVTNDRHFAYRAWVGDASSLEPEAILRYILKGMYYGTAPFAESSMKKESLDKAILSQLKGKRFLLVLDDVQDIHKAWNMVAPALPRDSGGRVVLITRTRGLELDIGISFHVLPVGRLSKEMAWKVFLENALGFQVCPIDIYNLICKEAKAVVEHSNGVPLSIVTIASTIRSALHDVKYNSNPDAWKNLLNRLEGNLQRFYHNVQTNLQRPDVQTALILSYNALSFRLKYVVLYCCRFSKLPGEIQVRKLIRLCVAEGFVEEIEHRTAEETMVTCLKQLIDLKLIIAVKTGISGSVETISVSKTMKDLASGIIEKAMFREFYSYKYETENVRRLFITHYSDIPSNKHEVTFVRSCFISKSEDPESFNLPCQLLVEGLRLLRVLDLKGMEVSDELLHRLGDLIHLRYLGLRATTIKDLPVSVSKLHNLQTLDIRETQVSHLPGEMMRHGKLRHVLLAGSFSRKVVELPWERKNIMPLHLQTLAGVRASIPLIRELQHWNRLQKLSIGCVRSQNFPDLCAAIKNMRFLRSLTIKTYRVETLEMEELSDARNVKLDTLKVGGLIISLCSVQLFSFLSRLYLWDSMLEEDPFLSLEGLSGLVVLCLTNAYKGKKMICNMGWFLKLKKLSVLRMKSLEEWIIEQGQLSNLENLFVGYCCNLKAAPQNITDVDALQLLQVSQMPEKFTTDLQEKLQEKPEAHVRVQTIPQFVGTE